MKETALPKLLVIGEGNFPKDIDSRTWKDAILGKLPNIAEYDTVILDMINIPLYIFEKLDEIKQLSLHQIHNLLWAGNELILITNGKSYITIGKKSFYCYPFLPVNIPFESGEYGKGSSVIVNNSKYESYYKNHVDNWCFYIKQSCEFPESYAEMLLSDREKNEYEFLECRLVNTIAYNGFKMPISFSVKYGYRIKSIYTLVHHQSEKFSGSITILQPPTKTKSTEMAIKTLLSSYGFHISTPPPLWTSNFVVPEENELYREMDKLKEQKTVIETELQNKEIAMNTVTRFKKILYESGDELRDRVWDTLEEIGFSVNRYDDGKEDGAIKEETCPILLEVKGKERGALAREDVRQLIDWLTEYTGKNDVEPKGLIVINHDRFKEPSERCNEFPDDVVKSVLFSSRNICAMTTLQLFSIYCMIKNGKLEAEKIRKRIVESRGIFTL